ncbi:hypothetical protein IWZ03DRAFT_362858 [Phyllosticta citriasiana]|uniref:Uncharacterized protein n=1 Tax=Phyllosticta citriasiana TaxID=595635 RepID=A0ABR1KDG7_9PEZI
MVESLSVPQMATRQAAATATFPAAEAAAAARPHREEEVPAALIPAKDDWRAQKTPTFCCSYKAANETDRRVPVNTLIFVTAHQGKSDHVIVGDAPNRRANAGKSPPARAHPECRPSSTRGRRGSAGEDGVIGRCAMFARWLSMRARGDKDRGLVGCSVPLGHAHPEKWNSLSVPSPHWQTASERYRRWYERMSRRSVINRRRNKMTLRRIVPSVQPGPGVGGLDWTGLEWIVASCCGYTIGVLLGVLLLL